MPKTTVPKHRTSCRVPIQVMFFLLPTITKSGWVKLIGSFLFSIFSGTVTIYELYLSIDALTLDNITLMNSIVSFFIGTIFFLVELKKYWTHDNKVFKFENRTLPHIKESDIEAESEYKVCEFKEGQDAILYSEKVNSYLIKDIHQISLNFKEDVKKQILSNYTDTQKDLFRNMLLFKYETSRKKCKEFKDDQKVSLNSSIYLDTKRVDLYQSSYYFSFITNDLTSHVVKDSSKCQDSLVPLPFDFLENECHGEATLKPIDELPFSNQIGINVIGITKDGFMKLWVQGHSAQRSSGKLAATGAGGMDFDHDFKDPYEENRNISLNDIVIRGMEREMKEESHEDTIREDFVKKTKVIGYYRWVGKGGLPGFFGVAKLNYNKEEITPNPDESYYQSAKKVKTEFPAKSFDDLSHSIKLLLDENDIYREKLSTTLFGNLKALEYALKNHKESLNFLFSK